MLIAVSDFKEVPSVSTSDNETIEGILMDEVVDADVIALVVIAGIVGFMLVVVIDAVVIILDMVVVAGTFDTLAVVAFKEVVTVEFRIDSTALVDVVNELLILVESVFKIVVAI